MPRNLVLFDLEWNIATSRIPLITMRAADLPGRDRGDRCREDRRGCQRAGHLSIHLRPRIFRKLQHHIAKVTGLTQADLDKGEPIVQGLRRFMQWCGPDAEFAEWGMDDVPVLKQNLYLCNIDESKPTVWYDLQQVFLREHPRKEGEGMTLESVVTA